MEREQGNLFPLEKALDAAGTWKHTQSLGGLVFLATETPKPHTALSEAVWLSNQGFPGVVLVNVLNPVALDVMLNPSWALCQKWLLASRQPVDKHQLAVRY